MSDTSKNRISVADVIAAKHDEWIHTAKSLRLSGLSVEQVAVAMKMDESSVRHLLKEDE